MSIYVIDVGPLERAIARLNEGWRTYQADPGNTLVRDGLIQRFEFTYELAHKTLKRYLEYGSPDPGQYDRMPFQDLIRSGNEQGLLLGDWPAWRRYRDMRAKTSHTYDEATALDVVTGIPGFMEEARYLLDQIAARLV